VNVKNARLLARRPHARGWFRAIRTAFLGTPLAVTHTVTIPGRFNYVAPGHPGFPILYLTEDPVTALFEVGAMLGSPHRTATSGPGRATHWAVINVTVKLSGVVDLTHARERRLVRTTVQELTGDWDGYRLRWISRPRSSPVWPTAPTQRLGRALHRIRGVEGFITYSARDATKRNLIVFPNKLRKGSVIRFVDPTGRTEELRGA
jgi:RES domain-containing protein